MGRHKSTGIGGRLRLPRLIEYRLRPWLGRSLIVVTTSSEV